MNVNIPTTRFPTPVVRLISKLTLLIIIPMYHEGYPKTKSGTRHIHLSIRKEKQLPPTTYFVLSSPTPFHYYYILFLQLKCSQSVGSLAALGHPHGMLLCHLMCAIINYKVLFQILITIPA